MKFSVLISIYAQENVEHLNLALNSLIRQTIKPDQIVLVKDGELTNELNELITSYVGISPETFTIVSLEENRGLGVALNEGMVHCRNELIARMDGDDICHEKRFEKQLLLFEKNPILDIVGSNIVEFDGSVENILSKRKMPLSDDEIKRFAKKRNPFNHVSVMYKKASVIDAGGYLDFLGFEDYYLWVRMILNEAICQNIDDNLVYVRTGSKMFKRRGGWIYAKKELKLLKTFHELAFLNKIEYLTNFGMRFIVRIAPNFLRKWIYLNFARK